MHTQKKQTIPEESAAGIYVVYADAAKPLPRGLKMMVLSAVRASPALKRALRSTTPAQPVLRGHVVMLASSGLAVLHGDAYVDGLQFTHRTPGNAWPGLARDTFEMFSWRQLAREAAWDPRERKGLALLALLAGVRVPAEGQLPPLVTPVPGQGYTVHAPGSVRISHQFLDPRQPMGTKWYLAALAARAMMAAGRAVVPRARAELPSLNHPDFDFLLRAEPTMDNFDVDAVLRNLVAENHQ